MAKALEVFGYTGKRAFVVGGASGIGAATAQLLMELGAEVVVADYTEIPFDCAGKIHLDLREPGSIAAAVSACGSHIDALFSCAGIAEGPDLMLVNFIGQRELIERCIDGGLMPSGSAVGMIASNAGLGWQQNLPLLIEVVDTPDYSTAKQWADEHPELNHYAFTKEVVIAYCARRALSFMHRGVRINALCPTSTDTPLARRSGWLDFGTDFRAVARLEVSTPIEQAYPFVFLCSQAAAYVTGTTLGVDGGVHAARVTGTFRPEVPATTSRE